MLGKNRLKKCGEKLEARHCPTLSCRLQPPGAGSSVLISLSLLELRGKGWDRRALGTQTGCPCPCVCGAQLKLPLECRAALFFLSCSGPLSSKLVAEEA